MEAPAELDSRIRELYTAFNERDIDTVLSSLHHEVEWSNGWEGGWVNGRDEVRAYWTRQWNKIDPTVTPKSIWIEDDGRVVVEVFSLVKDANGITLGEGTVQHVYRMRDDLFDQMEIRDDRETS